MKVVQVTFLVENDEVYNAIRAMVDENEFAQNVPQYLGTKVRDPTNKELKNYQRIVEEKQGAFV